MCVSAFQIKILKSEVAEEQDVQPRDEHHMDGPGHRPQVSAGYSRTGAGRAVSPGRGRHLIPKEFSGKQQWLRGGKPMSARA